MQTNDTANNRTTNRIDRTTEVMETAETVNNYLLIFLEMNSISLGNDGFASGSR